MSTENPEKPKRSVPTESSKTFKKDAEIYYKRTKANDEVITEGLKIIESMSDEEYENIGNKADTLHFIHLLGLASKKTTRKVKSFHGTEVKDCSTPVGVRLKTDINIEVPYLKDVIKNKDTGIDLKKDIQYKTVKAGKIFDLTLYEFMYLIIRDEYGGFLKVIGEDFYAHLSVKLPAFWRGATKLPTPTIVFQKKMGSSRGNLVDIDYQNSEDKWEIKDGFERFKPFLESRNKKTKINRNQIKKMAIAFQEKLAADNVQSEIKSVKDLVSRGDNIIRSLSIEQKKLLGSKASTLHIKNVLVLKGKQIGAALVSNEEISIPIIDISKNIKTGINSTSDISYRTVKAGEQFDISNYEFMYLIIRDEYAGFCSFDGDKEGAYFLPNLSSYLLGKSMLPYPQICSSYNYRIPSIEIVQKSDDGSISIGPKYKEKFGLLIEER